MKRSRLLWLLCVGCALGMAVLREPVADASGAAATVAVVRRPDLTLQVWPGDFNGDGIVDLVGTAPAANANTAGVVRVLLGNGSGGFPTAKDTTYAGHVIGTSDFNNDGKLDLIAMSDPGPGQKISILPGKGDGTFGSAIDITALDLVPIARGFDMDGDGNRDLVILNRDGSFVYVYPGHGDFTFGAAVNLETPTDPSDMFIADLNGDGRQDIVVSTDMAHSVSVFLNEGSMHFSPTDISLDRSANGVVAQDVNGDGKLDLVLAMATPTQTVAGPMYTDGYAYVMSGHGDGTFSAPAKYPVAPGAYQIAVGDFNRDGVPDIATANRSTILYDDCTRPQKTWDSVSILPGTGNGTFALHSSFSIGNQHDLTDMRYRNTVTSLHPADVNGDHQFDLVVSQGVLFLNQPTDPNWPPTVTASSTQPGPGDHSIVLSAVADDVDQDMLTYSWTDSGGTSIPPVPYYCFTPSTLGVHTFTVTVSDRDGNKASSSVTVDFGGGGTTPPTITFVNPSAGSTITAGAPYTFKVHIDDPSMQVYEWTIYYSVDGIDQSWIPGCHLVGQPSQPGTPTSRDETCTWSNPGPAGSAQFTVVAQDDADAPITSGSTVNATIAATTGAVPDPWKHQDIGAVAAAGTATYSAGTFTVRGSGADIWGNADEFQYLYTDGFGDLSTANPGAWEITTHVDSVQDLQAWTKAGLMIRDGLAATARHASVFVTPGKGIAFQRRTTAGGASVNTTGPATTAPVWLKLSVTNNVVSAYYRKNVTDLWTLVGRETFTAPFSQAEMGAAVTSHQDGAVASATFSQIDFRGIPTLTSTDVGTTGGSTSTDNVVTTLTAKGADVWGTSDQFRFASTYWNLADGSITARVRTVQNVNAWTKAGVMFRETAVSGVQLTNAKYVFVMVTPGKGVTMQYRSATGGSAATAGSAVSGTAPGWVRITKRGTTYTGAWSTNGVTWTTIGTVDISFGAQSDVGLALTSHAASAASASFDDLKIDSQ